jgi:ABC-2 type transport system permease protein
VPAVALAAALGFLAGWVLAMAAFWTTRIAAINEVYFVAMLFSSGEIAPLALMPPVAQTLASLLPFRWAAAFPVELLLGRLTPEAALDGFAAQVMWLAILLALLKLVWRAAARRYSAVGG